jgi:hypothetical protein
LRSGVIELHSYFRHRFAQPLPTAVPIRALRRVFYIPLATLQRVAIGYDGLYVQVEESQVGERGAYTLLTMNSRKTDLFIDSLKRAVRHTIPDLDAYEDPNIVSVDDVSKVLAPVLSEYELPGSLSVKLYMLIVTKNVDQAEQFATRSLLVSSRHIYLLKQDYVNQPAPTFILSTSAARPSFEVLGVFPVNGRVANVLMYDDCAEIEFTSGLGTVSNQPWHRFTGFGVCLTFNLGGHYGVQSFDVRMPTSCQRDTFLTTLMHSRSRDAESLSLPLLGRSSTSNSGSIEMTRAATAAAAAQKRGASAEGVQERSALVDGLSRES